MNVRAKKTKSKPVARKAPKQTSLLFSTMRNEAPFVLEWVAYHRAIGFDRIVICSEPSDDGTDELLACLAKNGIIEHHPLSDASDVAAHQKAARLANSEGLLDKADWVLRLDPEDFLVVSVGDGTVDALTQMLGEGDGVIIPLRMMGDGGNDTFSGRLISDDFTDASAAVDDANLGLRTFYRNGQRVEGLSETGIHRPKLRPGAPPDDFKFVTASGSPVDTRLRRNVRWLNGEDFSRSGTLIGSETGYGLAQINRYGVQTPDHFALKHLHDPNPDGKAANTAQVLQAYSSLNRSQTADRQILRFADATTKELDTLSELPEMGDAIGTAHTKTAQRLEAVSKDFVTACIKGRAPRPEPRTFPLTLPDEAADLVRSEYTKADVVLEYGSGGSSFVALEKKVRALFTVESDRNWAMTIHDTLHAAFPDANFTVNYAEIGETKAWGKPKTADGFANYSRYATGVWDLAHFEQPDVVLVDGRFRVACFLTTLFRSTRPVTILFDDYVGRSEYHWVEKYAKPQKFAGRMARFRVKPMAIPVEDLTQIIAAYANPA